MYGMPLIILGAMRATYKARRALPVPRVHKALLVPLAVQALRVLLAQQVLMAQQD